MTQLQRALLKLQVDLRQLGLRWALIGGLAVSMRGEPRTTRDLDVTVAVTGDSEVESVISKFMSRGYRVKAVRKHPDLKRVSSVRLLVESSAIRGAIIDLMFASSGIEEEVITASEVLEVFPGVAVPVATTAHLLALKTLAGRAKDVIDFATLAHYASDRDLQQAREALEMIARRGADRGKDLQAEFAQLLGRAPREI